MRVGSGVRDKSGGAGRGGLGIGERGGEDDEGDGFAMGLRNLFTAILRWDVQWPETTNSIL